MNYLFIHNNYPAQFRYMVAALAKNPENRVVFLSQSARDDIIIQNVQRGTVPVPEPKQSANPIEYENLLILRRSEAFANAMLQLKKQGFTPDCICDHCGWGAAFFANDIFPHARRVSYFEWYFNKHFPDEIAAKCEEKPAFFAQSRIRNSYQLQTLAECHAAYAPTYWQREQYPNELRNKIQVVHEGVDTNFFTPPATDKEKEACSLAAMGIPQAQELLTYTTRAFEPMRGFPVFWRSLPAILAARPNCHVVIMGNDSTSYDPKRPDGKGYLAALLEELPLDPARVHILPYTSYPRYRTLLRASAAHGVHVYLTKPYVLSWSLLEAMSTGCLVVASKTRPVEEVAQDSVNALLVPFPDSDALSRRVIDALEQREALKPVQEKAREFVREHFSMQRCLQRQLALLNRRM